MILSVVSAAIVPFIIHTMTMNKIREIAVLKLVGASNRQSAGWYAAGAGSGVTVRGGDRGNLVGPIFPSMYCCYRKTRSGILLVMLMHWPVCHPRGYALILQRRLDEMREPPSISRGKTLRRRRPRDALKGVDMTIWPGEVVGLVGPSGSGKTTLLKCLGAVIEPTAGKMQLAGQTIYDEEWKIGDLRTLRRDRIGFVFQAPYLIPFLDVTDNIALLPMLAGVPNGQARSRAKELLDALDVGHRSRAQVSELSGGEQQRVSIARALANHPPVILADEPTAPLDSERALTVVRILNQMAKQYQTAIIVVTHDEKIIPTFKRIYHIRDGRTYEEAGEGRDA